MTVALVGPVRASDPENCLSCHRYTGLARMSDDGSTVELFGLDPQYYERALGPHARLRCTQCHDREAVGVIPHRPVSPVDCARMCHLPGNGGVEVRFSHDGVAAHLDQSVHSMNTLERSQELLGSPLRPGQSRCLLCHDEPTFRRAGQDWIRHAAPVSRCDVCHDETLPLDTPFMYWHVHARSQPMHSHAETTRLCALCHSHAAILEAFELPETTASYLASFHGKAMQLGDETTAGCLDCHAAGSGDVHLMLAKSEPTSPTHASNLADTCRSPACHPTAGVRVSSAAVHLDIAESGGIEYLIGVLFILLILATFGPSLVLQALELLQVVVGRHDPRQHEREQQARRLMATSTGREALKRFTPHQRVQHWVLAISFTLLVVTGFPIKFADRAWAQWLVDLMGGLHAARMLHRYAGVVLLAGLVYHLGYAVICGVQLKRRTGRSWLSIVLSMPMFVSPADLKHLKGQLAFLLFLSPRRPDGDRFTLKEKFEYFGVFWGTVLLGITGIMMWANAWTTELLPGRVLTVALLVHTFEAFLALLHVGIVHMIGVIFSPVVFPMSPAMFTGDTPVVEMAEAHAGMIDRVAAAMPKGGPGHE